MILFAQLVPAIKQDWHEQNYTCARCQCVVVDPWFSEMTNRAGRMVCAVCVAVSEARKVA